MRRCSSGGVTHSPSHTVSHDERRGRPAPSARSTTRPTVLDPAPRGPRRGGRRRPAYATAITTSTIAQRPGPPPASTAAVPFSPAISTGASAGRTSSGQERPRDVRAGHERTVEGADRGQRQDRAEAQGRREARAATPSTWKSTSRPTSRIAPRASSWIASASALPRNTPPGSSPRSRTVDRVPSVASMPDERVVASTDANSSASQSIAGAPRRERCVGGPEREGEQEEGEDAERQDLPEQHARAHLDAEVLAGDEHRVMPHGEHAPPFVTSRRTRLDRCTTRSATCIAATASWLDSTTVAPARAASSTRSSHSARPATSRPACGSSSSQSAGRRTTSHARLARRCWPAESERTGTDARRPVDPDALERRGQRGRRDPARHGGRRSGSPRRSAPRRRRAGARAARRCGRSARRCVARSMSRHPARHRCEARAGRRAGAADSSCPRRSDRARRARSPLRRRGRRRRERGSVRATPRPIGG